MEELSSLTSDIMEDLSHVLQELSEMPTITIRPISSEIKEQGDALDSIFTDLIDSGDALRESMSSNTDILLDRSGRHQPAVRCHYRPDAGYSGWF